MVRLPPNKFSQQSHIQKVALSLCQTLEREPSADEIAEVMQTDVANIDATLKSFIWHTSLDAPLSDLKETTVMDTIATEDSQNTETQIYHTSSLQIEVKRVLQVLSARQREILCDFYGIGAKAPLTLEEIGVKLSLTGDRVRQIKEVAIKKLRVSRNKEVLKSFLCT